MMFSERFLVQTGGLKVIESVHAYKTVIRVRGIPDVRKPNTRRPYFRKVAVRILLAYRVGDNLIIHPELWKKWQKEIAERVTKSVDEMARSAFGLGQTTGTPPPALTMNTFREMVEKLGPLPSSEKTYPSWPGIYERI